MTVLIPIAHAGHWFEGALYLAPVVILVVVLFVQGRKDPDDADVDVDVDTRREPRRLNHRTHPLTRVPRR